MSEPLRQSMRVRCSPDHAYDVFTNRVDLWWPPTHRKFETSTLTLEPRPGGRFFETSDAGEEAVLGEVLTCDPPRKITYTWHPGKISGPTHVEVTFLPEGTETVVNILHSEGNSALGRHWSERVALFTKGWGIVLPAFAACAEASAKSS